MQHRATILKQGKDIGVVIDNQLNFEDHMNEKINKANSIMGLIRRTFTYIDEPTFLNVIQSTSATSS